MLLLDRATIANLATPDVALEAVRRAFTVLDRRECLTSQSTHLELPNGGELHIKGGWIQGSRWIAYKVATGAFPAGGNSGSTIVIDATDGSLAALIADDGLLTELRTAAAGALATELLARPDASSLAVIGTGVQARYQVRALRRVRRISHITVWGRDRDRAAAFAVEIGADIAVDAESAVKTSDIVLTVTSARSPVVQGAWLKPGTHVTAVGADAPGKRELDDDVLLVAHHIACDDVVLSSHVGELQHRPDQAARAIPLSAVVTARLTGRCSPDDITVSDLCGLGIEDVAITEAVLATLLGPDSSVADRASTGGGDV